MRAQKNSGKQSVRSRPYLPRSAKETDHPQPTPKEGQQEAIVSVATGDHDDNGDGQGDNVNHTDLYTPPSPDQDSDSILCVWCIEVRGPEKRLSESEVPSSCWKCCLGVCRECIGAHMRMALEWDPQQVHCFRCATSWDFKYMVRLMGKEEIAKYLERATFKALEKSEYFRWCAADKCLSGQFYGEEAKSDPKTCCGHCGAVNCFNCRQPFHDGLTCKEYQDRDLRKHRALRDSTNKKVMRTKDVRRCPSCSTAVEHMDGCNHVMCITCGDEFLFDEAEKI